MDSPAEPSYRLDIADDTFLVAAPKDVAAVVAEPASWAGWWPDLRLAVTRDRGVEGQQWAVTGGACGDMEIWLEPWGDGVILHWYLRAEVSGPRRRTSGERARRRTSGERARRRTSGERARRRTSGERARRRAARERVRRGLAWKVAAHALKDRLEAGREPGQPRERPDPAGVKDPGGPAEAP